MRLLIDILPYAEIILSVILVLAIMLQQSGAGVGGALGGGDGGISVYRLQSTELNVLFKISLYGKSL